MQQITWQVPLLCIELDENASPKGNQQTNIKCPRQREVVHARSSGPPSKIRCDVVDLVVDVVVVVVVVVAVVVVVVVVVGCWLLVAGGSDLVKTRAIAEPQVSRCS